MSHCWGKFLLRFSKTYIQNLHKRKYVIVSWHRNVKWFGKLVSICRKIHYHIKYKPKHPHLLLHPMPVPKDYENYGSCSFKKNGKLARIYIYIMCVCVYMYTYIYLLETVFNLIIFFISVILFFRQMKSMCDVNKALIKKIFERGNKFN